MWSNLGVKPTWLFGETGNSALEADSRILPNQKKISYQDLLTTQGERLGDLL